MIHRMRAFPAWRRGGRLFIFGMMLAAMLAAPARGATGAATSATLTAAETYRQARRLDNLHFLGQARQLVEDGLHRFPDDWPLNQLYATIHSDLNRSHELIPYYLEKIAREPKNATGYAGAAVVNLLDGSAGAAEEYVKKAGELAPGSLAALMTGAWLERARSGGQPQGKAKIIATYKKLIAAYPDFPPGVSHYLLFLRGDEEHRAEYERVVEIAKAHKSTPLYLAYEMFDKRKKDPWFDPRTAIEVYGRILEIEPWQMGIKTNLAIACGDAGDPARQRQTLEEITREAPEWLEGWKNLAAFHARYQDYDAALASLERARQSPYDDHAKPDLELERAQVLKDAGRFGEAAAALREFIKTHKDSGLSAQARRQLTQLESRRPADRIHRLTGVPFLKQKGSYCGPASLSMVLGYWGIKKTQDEIAAEVYTGVAGTASQTIEAYCRSLGLEVRTFQGDAKTWKRLLDQGLPVLWLKYRVLTDGHYTVVTGYNELNHSFIIHNPWYASESTAEASAIDDEWTLPHLRLSLVIYPAARAGEFKLGELAAPWKFRAVNQIVYLATGSHLFQRFFPNILVSLAAAGVLILIVTALMRMGCGPRDGAAAAWYVALNAAAILVLGFVIHRFRSPLGVELLVDYHLSLLAMAAPMLTFALLAPVLGKIPTMGQAARWHGTLFVFIATVGWINHRTGLWFEVLFWGVTGCGILYAFYEWGILLARCRMKPRLSYGKAIARCRRFGSTRKGGRGLVKARLREAALEKRWGNHARAAELTRALLALPGIGRVNARLAEFLLIEALLGQAAARPEDGAALAEARQRLEAWGSRKLWRLEAFYREVLSARAALLAGEPGAAARHCQAARELRERGAWVRKLQRALDLLRWSGRAERDFRLLHALNRLALARAAGDEAEAATVMRECGGAIDEEFTRKAEYHALSMAQCGQEDARIG